jgi:magnesium transporter
MIVAYLKKQHLESQEITTKNQSLLQEAIWIDVFAPTKEEKILLEKFLGLNIPTREEMQEIELSSRLYKDNDILFMTAMMVAQSDSPEPKFDSVTFVLTQQRLITLRYIEPFSFTLFSSKLKNLDARNLKAATLLIELLDSIVDRLADTLELVGRRLDTNSKIIFQPRINSFSVKLNYQQLMQQIGTTGDLNAKAYESLVMFNRLITFFGQTANSRIDKEEQLRLVIFSKDIIALSEHGNFLSNKVIFLLDAILGLVNIEQNQIIKIVSIAAAFFLPPTLIASIYGMNFHSIPELSWKWGYFFALGLMGISAWLPYLFFKFRKWL